MQFIIFYPPKFIFRWIYFLVRSSLHLMRLWLLSAFSNHESQEARTMLKLIWLRISPISSLALHARLLRTKTGLVRNGLSFCVPTAYFHLLINSVGRAAVVLRRLYCNNEHKLASWYFHSVQRTNASVFFRHYGGFLRPERAGWFDVHWHISCVHVGCGVGSAVKVSDSALCELKTHFLWCLKSVWRVCDLIKQFFMRILLEMWCRP